MAASPAPEIIHVGDVFGPDDVRAYPDIRLPPDLSYCLDSEMEFGGIGGDERAYVDLFMHDAVPWFDSISDDGNAFAARLARRYEDWRTTAPDEEALTADWAGLESLRWLMEDCLTGIRSELTSSEALDEAAIAARMPALADARRFADRAGVVAARCAEDVARRGRGAFLAARGRAAALYEARRAEIGRRDGAIRAAHAAREVARAAPAKPAAADLRLARRKLRLSRRVLARSFRFLEGLSGRPRATAFLSGDTVNVEGRRFDFRLRVKDAHRAGHGALDVSVTDKDGAMLAALCVYAPQTPALDQVSALLLYVLSGEEDEILRTANVIIATEAASRHAAFVEVRGDPRVEALRQVGVLIGEMEEHSRRIVADGEARDLARRCLARWVMEGALAPLVAALGGTADIAGLLARDGQGEGAPA